ncbi:MAG TPA: hypothetical protein VGG33_14070 [Polyangia bacterium]
MPPRSPIAIGHTHTLFVSPNGVLRAWGGNSKGQLGLGHVTDRLNPTSVSMWRVLALAAGDKFSLAVDVNGKLFSWGRNSDGQLGRNIGPDEDPHSLPEQVITAASAIGWAQVAAGMRHALGIRADGTLWAWGDNGSGQLGLSDLTDRKTPTKVGADNDWILVSAGEDFSIALKADGTLWATGNNTVGQLGQDYPNSRPEFQKVGSSLYRAISAGGRHVLAIRDDGRLVSWGLNDGGQVGNNTKVNAPSPVVWPNMYWRSVSAGYRHSLAITTAGDRYGWGENTSGETGRGSTAETLQPTSSATSSLEEFVAAGRGSSFSIKGTGELLAYGDRGSGQLGIGSGTGDILTPTRPWMTSTTDGWALNQKPNSVVGGGYHTLAIRSSGQIESWGDNTNKALGPAGTTSLAVPAVRQGGNTWMMVAAGEPHSLALNVSGGLYAWGANQAGELGQATAGGPASETMKAVMPGDRFIKMAAHYSNNLALRGDGRLYGWGDNTNGQLGDGTFTNRTPPVPVGPTSPKRWVAMAVSGKNGYGITSNGKLWAWGNNASGQVGHGLPGEAFVTQPVQIGTNQSWVAIGAGNSHVIARTADGKLYGWGASNPTAERLLGLSTGLDSYSSPKALLTTEVLRDLSKGEYSTLVITDLGAVKGFGHNDGYELGLGHNNPVGPAVLTNWNVPWRIAMGYAQTIVIRADSGNRYGAGANFYGEVGTGNAQTAVTGPTFIPPGF